MTAFVPPPASLHARRANEGLAGSESPSFVRQAYVSNAMSLQLVRLPPIDGGAGLGNSALELVAHQEDVPHNSSSALVGESATLDDLVAYALGNNPALAAAQSRATALSWRVSQARSLDDPMLAATVFLDSIETAAGPQEVVLSLSQKLPWFGKRSLRGEVAFREAQAAFAQAADDELRVVEEMKLAYYELYAIDQSIAIHRELRRRLDDVINTARSRYETNQPNAGMESVLQAEVELSQLESTLVVLEQDRLKAQAKLAQALDLPSGAVADVRAAVDDAGMLKKVDLLLSVVDACQPLLDARREEIARSQAAASLARRNGYPDLNVGLNWYSIGDDGLSPIATGEDAVSLLVGANVPIYRQRLRAAQRETQLLSAQASQRYRAEWARLIAEVESLHADAQGHEQVLAILDREILPRATQTLDLSIESYRVGRIGFQQLIDNYRALLQFSIERATRQARRAQAIARLERAVGCAVLDHVPAEEVPAAFGNSR